MPDDFPIRDKLMEAQDLVEEAADMIEELDVDEGIDEQVADVVDSLRVEVKNLTYAAAGATAIELSMEEDG